MKALLKIAQNNLQDNNSSQQSFFAKHPIGTAVGALGLIGGSIYGGRKIASAINKAKEDRLLRNSINIDDLDLIDDSKDLETIKEAFKEGDLRFLKEVLKSPVVSKSNKEYVAQHLKELENNKTTAHGYVKFSDGKKVEFGNMEEFNKAMNNKNSSLVL